MQILKRTLLLFLFVLLSQIILFSEQVFAVDYGKDLFEKLPENKIEIAFDFTERCMFGDFNAIELEFTKLNQPDILLSLECLNNPENDITIKLFKKGDNLEAISNTTNYSHIVDLSAIKPGIYALKICGDRVAQGNCRNKKVTDIQEIIDSHGEKGTLVYDDKIYFHQLLISPAAQDLRALTADILTNKDQGLVPYLLSLDDNLSKTELEQELEVNKIISSAPFKVKNGTLQIELPKAKSLEKCHILREALIQEMDKK